MPAPIIVTSDPEIEINEHDGSTFWNVIAPALVDVAVNVNRGAPNIFDTFVTVMDGVNS